MTRKVIIDCDMGMDDAVALCLALFDDSLDILAVTAAEGCVTAGQATRNLQAIIGILDPPRFPRLGAASSCEHAPPVNTTYLYGDDGLGNSGFEVSGLQHMLPAEKLIIDCVRSNPGDVTIICLGPYTNLARAFRRDPNILPLVDRVVMTGGSVNAGGNITAAAEFNCFFDPVAAQEIFSSRTTRTLVPLDVTTQVPFDLGFMDILPDRNSRIGEFLRQILPYAYRQYRNRLGLEHIWLNDAVGLVALLEPDIFSFQPMAGQVETEGHLTRGVTVFDRRPVPEWRCNMEVAMSVEAGRVIPAMVQRLAAASNMV